MPTSTSKTRLLTFLFTDIEGSVAHWERNSRTMAGTLDTHTSIVKGCVAKFKGKLVRERGEGDSTFSTYDRPSDAVDAAIEIQKALYSHNWPDNFTIKVRAALHTGTAYTATRSGDFQDYNSPTVNRCARLRSLAKGQQVFITEATYLLLRDEGEGYKTIDHGYHHLKDLRRPERVYQLVIEPIPAGDPPISSSALADNLPEPGRDFIGRRSEIDHLCHQLEKRRLVCITGLSGGGKSALAREVAQKLKDQSNFGIFWADLSKFPGRKLHEALGSLLGFTEPSMRDVAEVLGTRAEAGKYLLVLDAYDHCEGESHSMLDQALNAVPNLKILGTGYKPISHSNEVAFAIKPMKLPDRHVTDYQTIRSCEAVALFEYVAQLHVHDFSVTPDNASTVAQICRDVDAFPLGIEVAAASLPILNLGALAKRLGDPHSLPKNSAFQSKKIESAVRSSYETLSDHDQLVMQAYCVFEGGWDEDAAHALGLDESEDSLPAIAALVQRCLVVRDDTINTTRYRFPRTVWNFARRLLDEHPERQHFENKHREFFRSLVERALSAPGDTRSDWFDSLEVDRGNIYAATRSYSKTGDCEIAAEMAVSLYHFWELRGPAREGIVELSAILANESLLGPKLAARVINAKGALLGRTGETRLATQAFETAKQLREQINDLSGVADIENNMANLLWDNGEFNEAESLFSHSIRQFELEKDIVGLAATESNLAGLLVDMGRLDEAETTFNRAIERDHSLGQLDGVAISLGGLSDIAVKRQDSNRARDLRREAIKMQQQLNDHAGLADSLEGMAEIDMFDGSAERAAVLLGAGERARELAEYPLPNRRWPARRRLVDSLRTALHDHYHVCWAKGRALSSDDAIHYALGMSSEVIVATAQRSRVS